jgi:RecB family endonuclease NucS
MNQEDRNNLNFLLTVSPQVLLDWFTKTHAEDHAYAKQIMDMYQHELDLREQIIHVDRQVASMTTFPDAERVLKKFVDMR